MDSKIFTEPHCQINCGRLQCTVGIFIACTYIYLKISRGQSFIILHMGWGYNWGGYEHFSKDKLYKAFWRLF